MTNRAPLQVFEDEARKLLTGHLGSGEHVVLEEPPEGMGDFAVPAFTMAKELRKAASNSDPCVVASSLGIAQVCIVAEKAS